MLLPQVVTLLESLFLPLLILVMWVVISIANAATVGWTTLAFKYRTGQAPVGVRFPPRSNPVRVQKEADTRFNTGAIIGESGLYLYRGLPHRFMCPPVLIPWDQVKDLSPTLPRSAARLLDLAGVMRVRLSLEAYAHAREFLSRQAPAA